MKNGNDIPDLPDLRSPDLLNLPSPDLQAKLPRDVKFVGWLHLVTGVLLLPMGVLGMVGVLDSVYANQSAPTLLGLARLTSGLWFGVNHLVMGFLSAVAGYGLLKRHPLGWWLLLVVLLYGVVNMTVGGRFLWWNVFFWLGVVLTALTMAWLIFRARLYHPFGKASKFVGK